MKDRLARLLSEAEGLVNNDLPTVEQIADYLLDNGVIVPPCKVGQTVWFPSEYHEGPYPVTITHLEISEEEIIMYSVGGGEWRDTDIGKTLFLTREEAEKALAERSEDVTTDL